MTDAGASRRDAIEAGALALQRVLALEGRNALARVELAASELMAGEARPAARDRLTAIREAVGALDDVLDKIERLSDPLRPDAPGAATAFASVWQPLVARLGPALRARGLALETTGDGITATIALTGPVLERLLLALLRSAVSAVGESAIEPEGGASRIVVECRDEEGALALCVRVFDRQGEVRLALAQADRVELEIALAQASGALLDAATAWPRGIGLRLPRVHRDA